MCGLLKSDGVNPREVTQSVKSKGTHPNLLEPDGVNTRKVTPNRLPLKVEEESSIVYVEVEIATNVTSKRHKLSRC